MALSEFRQISWICLSQYLPRLKFVVTSRMFSIKGPRQANGVLNLSAMGLCSLSKDYFGYAAVDCSSIQCSEAYLRYHRRHFDFPNGPIFRIRRILRIFVSFHVSINKS